jgi:hypothetical protein
MTSELKSKLLAGLIVGTAIGGGCMGMYEGLSMRVGKSNNSLFQENSNRYSGLMHLGEAIVAGAMLGFMYGGISYFTESKRKEICYRSIKKLKQ